jgi:hypothetical protein
MPVAAASYPAHCIHFDDEDGTVSAAERPDYGSGRRSADQGGCLHPLSAVGGVQSTSEDDKSPGSLDPEQLDIDARHHVCFSFNPAAWQVAHAQLREARGSHAWAGCLVRRLTHVCVLLRTLV